MTPIPPSSDGSAEHSADAPRAATPDGAPQGSGDTRKDSDDMSNLAPALENVTPIRPRLAALPQPADAQQPAHDQPATPARPAPAARPAAPAAPLEAAETRGFALYVGLDEDKAALDGTSLTELVTELRRLAAKLAPHATTHATVALAPQGAGGRDVDVVRLALGDREALAQKRAAEEQARQPAAPTGSAAGAAAPATGRAASAPRAEEGIEGVTVDTTRQRVLVDGVNAHVTYTEFELLQSLVLREGRAVSREELIGLVWRPDAEPELGGGERPSDRTIDVHIRRLRGKLGEYADIIRTVRGQGYRFDRHADVEVLRAPGRSPERF